MSLIGRIVEHNNWANQELIRACRALTDAQLDARPLGEDAWSIRRTLTHVLGSQRNYVQLLTRPVAERVDGAPAWEELEASAGGAPLERS